MVILEQASSSSSSSINQWKYHVFLSFRGTDTRSNFTGHLYNALIHKGINTYKDDPELPKGGEISTELLQAIQDSNISIIVFSENYASSSWCLDELVKILDCKKSNKQMVHPIFYKVEPSDIRYLKGSFGEALAKHECRFKDNLEKVNKWKQALTEAANLSGWTLSTKNQNQSESILVDEIVEEISRQLISRTYLDVAKYPVGVEPRVEAVNNLLGDLEGKDVRMVGVWGTGGMGKTTLAKAVYNSIALHFEGCCFLENVRENSMSYRGLDQSIDNSKICKLQEKLLSQILGGKQFIVDSASKGITMIKEKLKWRRVLIVLDDVNDMDQLDNLAGESGWFGKGTRVIITTRDMQLLRAHNVDLMYNIKKLNYYEAFKLFSRNALKRNEPLEVYKDLIDRAIVRAQGLPLALSVLGSSLCGKRVERWQATIDSFKSNKIQEVLKISYDGLEETTKEVFLDIACFFKGEDRRHVIQMLQGCGLKPEHEIEDLIEKALIRIDCYGCVTMHDLLEEMGKDIVNQESPNDPGERSRLWFHDDVYHVLTENSGTRKIIGIKVELPQDSDEICLNVGTFSKMKYLRLFIYRAGSFSGVNLDYLPNSLRVVDWPNCPLHFLPFNFNPRNLALLNMPKSRTIEIGKTLKHLTNLTSINLRGCEYLIKVSDLSGVPNLQSLDLAECTSLVEVHHSVGRLDRLCSFNLSGCSKLTNFPSSVTWKSMTSLWLIDCTRLENFIELVNKMESIANLDLRGSGIKELPSWIGYLTSLTELNMSGTPVKELPSSIGKLTSLIKLDLSETPVKELLSSIGNLTSLVKLDMSGTLIEELPSSIGNLTSLVELDLSGTLVKELPSSIGNLTSLVELDLSRTPVKELPSSIGNLTSLVQLDLSGTPLKELPSSIGNLTSLVKLLDMSGTLIEELPSSIRNLTSLVELELSGTLVKELPSWIGSLTSLVKLDVSGTLIEELPSSIGNLIGLEDLYLQECENLVNVPDSVYGGLQRLEILDLSWCPKLVTFPTNPDTCNSASSLFPQLRYLRFEGCKLVSLFDFLSNLDCMSTLWFLDLSGSSFNSLPACITKFRGLTHLFLSDCKWLRDITELPPYTSIVDLANCVALERFSTFSNILEQRGNQLSKKMDLTGCYRLVDNLGINELVSKFENAFRNRLVNNDRPYKCSVTFPILRGSKVPEWFDKHVLLENTCEIVIEIPPSLKWEKTGLAVCLVYQTDPNFLCTIGATRTTNGIEINGRFIEKKNVPNETESSKVHDHVWVAVFQLMTSKYRVCFHFNLFRGDVVLIKSCGVHLINLPEDIPIDDDYHYNAEGAAAISELSDAAIHTKRGLQLVHYDDHPTKRIKQATDGAGPSNHHP